MTFEVRYERSFLKDMKLLDPVSYKQVFVFVFVELPKVKRLKDLPEFRQILSQGILYRFSLQDYYIAIEVTGHLVKFIRILPKNWL